MWTCPACHLPLIQTQQQWCCETNHSYDIAKEGYVNLLLAHQKRSKDPGDNKQMVNARRQFLELGCYLPLLDKMLSLIEQYQPDKNISLYDAGCGEGYYLNYLYQHLQQASKHVTAAGSDIAKAAIQKAAKKYQHLEFAVASSFNLPLAPSSVDCLIQVFAPISSEQVSRVLTDGGIWLQVTPGAGHLQQIKQAIYQTPEPHKAVDLPAGFDLVETVNVQFDFELSTNADRENLLKMTPYYWSVEQGKLQQVLDNMQKLSADFSLQVLKGAKSDG